MQTKEQKRLVALERIEKRLLEECDIISKNPYNYRLSYHPGLVLHNTKMVVYLGQANDIRLALNMSTLHLSAYDTVRGNLVITDGYSQFYPQED